MASRYLTLRQNRLDLMAEWKAMDERAAADGNRTLTEDERARVSAIETQIASLDADLLIEERRREAERSAPSQDRATPADGLPRISSVRDRAAEQPYGLPYAHMSAREARAGAFGEFLQEVAQGHSGRGMPPRLAQYLAAAQGAGEVIGADGGFLVMQDHMAGIQDLMHDIGRILPLVRRIPLSPGSNGVKINAIKETSRVTGSRFGGVQGYWVDEGTAPTATRPKFRKMSLELKKLAALGYATDELLQDALALGTVMTEAFAEELTFLTEDALIEGTGAGQPLGVLNAGCTVSVAKEAGQAAATIVTTNLSKMWARLPARSGTRANWYINVDCQPQLDELVLVAGTGGLEPRFVVYGPDGVLRIKGRPVVPVEYCATIGTVGDIILADWSQYALIDRGGVQQASSLHVAFTTDEWCFRATYRVDGQPFLESPVTPFKGTATQSPFITLASRA